MNKKNNELKTWKIDLYMNRKTTLFKITTLSVNFINFCFIQVIL